MRISNFERNSIIKNAKKIFGRDVEIFLFGSRIDDNKKGGDIDLYVKTNIKDNLHQKKFNFIIALEDEIGEQKIDVIIAKDSTREIEKEAIKNGIIL
jgi:predicted nucleotidyltransferase